MRVSAYAQQNRSTTTQGIVVVQIGFDREKYQVHKALLMRHSEHFRKALVGSWKEAMEQVVTLEDVESSTCESRPKLHSTTIRELIYSHGYR